MILGIGIDIVEISRIEKSCKDYGDKFLNRIFTSQELRYAQSKTNPYPSLAVRFAAKEALVKATREGKYNTFAWQDAEVSTDTLGIPHFICRNDLENILKDKKVHVSLSHSEHYAAAMVVIED